MAGLKIEKTIVTDDNDVIEINTDDDFPREGYRLLRITGNKYAYGSEGRGERVTIELELSQADREILKAEL